MKKNMKNGNVPCLLTLAVWALFPGAAGTLQAGEWTSTATSEPAPLFGEKCGMCHRAQGMGTILLQRRYDAGLALLENRRDLQPEFIRSVVRGGFNNMFPIGRGEVSDAQLDIIAGYLTQERAE